LSLQLTYTKPPIPRWVSGLLAWVFLHSCGSPVLVLPCDHVVMYFTLPIGVRVLSMGVEVLCM